MKRFGALFDLDGVLVDSESQYTVFWDDIERRYPTGIPDYAVAIKGTTLTTILSNYETDEIRNEITSELHRFEETMPYPVMDGVFKLLEEMRQCGWKTAIVTSSDDVKMSRLIAADPELITYFDIIIDGSMVTKSKPDPQGYMMAAEALGLDNSDCFVFEDSLQGLSAGRASGSTVVGLATTFPRKRLEQTGCTDIIIDSLVGLNTEILMKLKG